MRGDLITSDTASHVHLASDSSRSGARQDGLEGTVLGDIASYSTGFCQTDKHVHIVVQSDAASSGCKGVCRAQLLSIVHCISSHLIVNLLVIKDVLSFSNAFRELNSSVNGIPTD